MRTRGAAYSVADPIAILGGSGFIGTRLAGLLTAEGFAVRIGDLQPSLTFPELWKECDVRRLESVRDAIQGTGMIVNLAAEHRDDVRPLSRYHETNVEGASQVCSAAEELGVHKIVFASSVAVYGFQSRPVDETGPFAPFNAYGETKLEAENIYRNWAAKDASRSLVIVRPTVVFGEGNRGNVYNLLHQIATGKFLMVGTGKNIKSMAYVGNVAAFLVHVLKLGSGTHTFNYVDGPDLSTQDLVGHIRRCMGKEGPVSQIPLAVALAGGHLLDMVARVSGRRFPISAIRVRKFCENTQFQAQRMREIDFTPPYTLEEGLARTIESEFPRT